MFKDSCVTELTPWTVREEATALPVHIMPAYVGSGHCVLSIDASGLQGLNHGVQSAFGAVSGAGDMYLIKEYMVGNQLSEDNVLPLGYLEWRATVDGAAIHASTMPAYASCWERVTYIDEAKVVTHMLLDARVALEIAVWQPLGTDSTVMVITVRGHDVHNKPIVTPRQVTLQLGIVLKTRQGAPLYARCEPRGSDLEVEFDGHERYVRRYSMVSSAGSAPEFADGWYGLNWSVAAGPESATLTCLLSIDEQHGVEEVPSLWREHLAAWHRYYGSVTHIEGLDARESFLFHNSLYLLHSGFSFDRGVALGNGFAHPWCWRASTFWDAACVMDALLRVGEQTSSSPSFRPP